MSKSSENVIKSAEAATDPKAMSAASETSAPAASKPQGDGMAPYKEDMSAIYQRLKDAEKLIDDLGKEIIDIKSRLGADKPDSERSIEQRFANIEARLSDHKGGKGAGHVDLRDADAHSRIDKLEQRLTGVVA